MRHRWYTAALALLLLSPNAAKAGSVHTVFFDSNGNLVPGTLTATLDLWARPLGADQPIKVDSFSFGIGSDFWLAVPQAVIDSHASWEDTIPPGNSPYGDWVLAEPGLSGVSLFPFGFFSGLDTDVALLADWCATPQVAGGQDLAFVNGIFVMALRGDCVFSQKVTNIEASYAVGALIVNDSENGGASTISLGTLNPGIPAITLSYQRGEQIIALEQTHNIVYIDFDARWDPDPSAVPEPATLMLVSGGLALAAAPRLRRRRERLPREPHT